MTGPQMHSGNASALPQGELLRWRANLKIGDRVYWPPNGIVELVLHQQHRWDVSGAQLIGVKSAPEHELRPIPGMAYTVNPSPLPEAGEIQNVLDGATYRTGEPARVGDTISHYVPGRSAVVQALRDANHFTIEWREWDGVELDESRRWVSEKNEPREFALVRREAEPEMAAAEVEIAAPTLPLSQIRVDGGTQARTGVNWETVTNYAELMAVGVDLPPVIVYFDGAEYWLADGFHRYHAAKQLNLNEMAVEVKQGDARAARLHAAGANSTHGLPRTNDDKRRAVLLLLNDSEWAQWSDREIARRCAVGHSMVSNIRLLSVHSGQISERTVERGGKTYAMNTAQIGQKTAEPPARPLLGGELRSIEEAAAHAPHYAAYREFVAAHPGRLALMLHSLWYTAWDESVDPIRSVLGYRASSGGVDQTIRRPMVSISEISADESIALLTAANFSLAVMERDGSVRLIEPDGTSMPMDEASEAAHAAAFARIVDEDTGEIETAMPPVSPRQALHSSMSNEWYTPARYLKAAHKVMGGIDLDPASSEAANRNVQAAQFFTADDDGLAQEWYGRVWLNPPYGKEDGESNQARWLAKLFAEFEAGRVSQAIVLVNAATANDWFKRLWDFPICFTDHRIRFLSSDGIPQDSPTNGNAFVYLAADDDWYAEFAGTFREFGPVVMETWR